MDEEPQGKLQQTTVKQHNVSISSPTSSIIKSKRINRDIRACGILSELVVYTSYQNTAEDQHLQRWEQLGTAGTGPE